MAKLDIPVEARRIEERAEIAAELARRGIQYEYWEVAGRIDGAAPAESILAAYAPELSRLMQAGGYVTADVIDVSPATPGLDAMLAKFNQEHTHSEDEVRFCVLGRGVFHIHPAAGPVFAIELEPGDLINVPRGTRHWFDLCSEKRIRAIRLFQDKTGWTPYYVEGGVHAGYVPVCWGPTYLPPRRLPPALAP